MDINAENILISEGSLMSPLRDESSTWNIQSCEGKRGRDVGKRLPISLGRRLRGRPLRGPQRSAPIPSSHQNQNEDAWPKSRHVILNRASPLLVYFKENALLIKFYPKTVRMVAIPKFPEESYTFHSKDQSWMSTTH